MPVKCTHEIKRLTTAPESRWQCKRTERRVPRRSGEVGGQGVDERESEQASAGVGATGCYTSSGITSPKIAMRSGEGGNGTLLEGLWKDCGRS